jgi:tRNA1(Val) A37 N6-methylase TrmN6
MRLKLLQRLEIADNVRRAIAPRTTQKHKSEFGQFMTPSSVARFMASLFPQSPLKTCRLLDAGAGVGALSCAFLDRWVTGDLSFESVDATAYEIDEKLRGHLAQHLAGYSRVTPRIIAGDYIEQATAEGLQDRGYTHAILNPPYKKINSQSAHRLARGGLEEAQRNHAQRRNGKVALPERVLLPSAPFLIEGGKAARGGKRG